jgi:hypothetical protein
MGTSVAPHEVRCVEAEVALRNWGEEERIPADVKRRALYGVYAVLALAAVLASLTSGF